MEKYSKKMHKQPWQHFGSKSGDNLMTEKTYARLNEKRGFFALFHFVKSSPKGKDLSSKTLFVTIKTDTPQDVKKIVH